MWRHFRNNYLIERRPSHCTMSTPLIPVCTDKVFPVNVEYVVLTSYQSEIHWCCEQLKHLLLRLPFGMCVYQMLLSLVPQDQQTRNASFRLIGGQLTVQCSQLLHRLDTDSVTRTENIGSTTYERIWIFRAPCTLLEERRSPQHEQMS